MKFELPPPLPERRATPARPKREERDEALPKTSAQNGSGSAPASRRQEGGSPPPTPEPSRSQPVENKRPATERYSPAGLKHFSIPRGFVVPASIVGLLVLVGVWTTFEKPRTRSADAQVPSYVPDSTPTPTPQWGVYNTPNAEPTISMRQVLPPIYATPTPVLPASPVFHVVKVRADDYLYVHEGPGSNYAITWHLAPATDGISITGAVVKNGTTLWVPIVIGQVQGWVCRDYLAASGAQAEFFDAQGQKSSLEGERYPQTRLRLLTSDDLKSMSPAQLRYAINEVYARYGASFPNNPDVRKQFQKFSWYHPNPNVTFSDIDQSMLDIEKQNVALLGQYRDRRRSR
jgi:YARHG domain